MSADFVCNMCGKQFMAKKALSDHNRAVHIEVESPCNTCDKTFRHKKTSLSTLGMYMLQTKNFTVTSNPERFHAFIIPQGKAIWRLTRKECTKNLMMTFPNLCVLCVVTKPTESLT